MAKSRTLQPIPLASPVIQGMIEAEQAKVVTVWASLLLWAPPLHLQVPIFPAQSHTLLTFGATHAVRG